MSILQVANVRTKLNSFTIWIAFAGKPQASILLTFTSLLRSWKILTMSYFFKIIENSTNLKTGNAPNQTNQPFWLIIFEPLNVTGYIVQTTQTNSKERLSLPNYRTEQDFTSQFSQMSLLDWVLNRSIVHSTLRLLLIRENLITCKCELSKLNRVAWRKYLAVLRNLNLFCKFQNL